jgi:decaprenylphospho-beta-D-ribofuranose 2-oxidase
MNRQATLSGWGRSWRSRSLVLPGGSDEELAEALAHAGPAGVIARGLGRAYGDAACNGGGTVLDLTARNRILAWDDRTGVVTVEAGTSIDRLLRTFLPAGWFVPAMPGTRHVTVGGAIAADVHGKDHHTDGGCFCQHVLSFDLLTADGTVHTVTPEATPQLFWATAGGMGLTGVVLRATLRLRRVHTAYLWVRVERVPDLATMLERLTAGGDGARYAVAWMNLSRGPAVPGLVSRGRHAELGDLGTARRSALDYRVRRAPSLPPIFGPGLVHRWTVAPFDALWERRAPRQPTERLQAVAPFFHPLDAVANWNRAYGRWGFVQYQFVVPFGAEAALQHVVEAVRASRQPTFMPVLKALGPADPGLLSFPMPGWTLALDLRATDNVSSLLDQLDELVCRAGGRIYLAKDVRARPGVLAAMYARLGEFQALRRKLDPERVFVSDLARRLNL